MVPELTVSIDQVEMEKTLQKLQATGKAVGLTVKHLGYDTMRNALNNAVRLTAPRTQGASGGTWGEQKKIGFGAVEHDLDRGFARIENPAVYLFAVGGKLMSKSKKKNIERMGMIEPDGAIFVIPQELWQPDIKAHHDSIRDRFGRVKQQHRQAWVKTAKLKKHTREVQKRVGSLKAGWLPALTYFAGLVHGKVKAPLWVKKQAVHAGFPAGKMEDNGNGEISAHNTSHHSGAIRRSMIEYINKETQKDVDRWLPIRIEAIAKKYAAGNPDGKAVVA